MLNDLSARLTRAVEQKKLKQKHIQDLQAVELELREQSDRLSTLGHQMEKEKVDVDKLEKLSLTALFYSVLGSREQQLDKERQELLAAQLAYQRLRHQVEFLKREQEDILRQVERLGDVESQYEILLSEKEHMLSQSDPVIASQLFELSEQIGSLNSEEKEITEAITAGDHVITSLEQVIDSLESAKSWGTWDMLGGDFIATAVKHSRIDDARSGINTVQEKMSQLTRELADVQQNVELSIDITEFTSFADFFMDGLIIDWIVQSKIVDSLERSKKAKDAVSEAVRKLEDLRKVSRKNYMQLQEKHRLLIENA